MRTAKTLIRLGGCPGWSESLQGAHSFCSFCHVMAHMLLISIDTDLSERFTEVPDFFDFRQKERKKKKIPKENNVLLWNTWPFHRGGGGAIILSLKLNNFNLISNFSMHLTISKFCKTWNLSNLFWWIENANHSFDPNQWQSSFFFFNKSRQKYRYPHKWLSDTKSDKTARPRHYYEIHKSPIKSIFPKTEGSAVAQW